MTPDEFKTWRKALGFSQKEAADALGISASSVELYEKGKRRDDGRPVEIPRSIELACQAVQSGAAPAAGEAAPVSVLASYVAESRSVRVALASGGMGCDLRIDIEAAQRLRAELDRAIREGIEAGAG